MNCVLGMYVPILMESFIKYIESEDNIGDAQAWNDAVKTGCMIMFIKIWSHTFWENLCYYMIETGHKSHTSLKTIMFVKAMKCSPATNKTHSSGEILNLIERDCNKVWSFIWDLPAVFEIPFELIVASYYIFKSESLFCDKIKCYFFTSKFNI